jgi:glutathione synthase/RimK-type ligase-like ATP-grasp enzyme
MVVGIHLDPDHGVTEAIERYEAILDFNGISHLRLETGQPDFWQKVATLDLFVFPYIGTARQHQQAPTILTLAEEHLGIVCFPDTATWWHYDDKVREAYLLERHSFPAAESWVFWTREDALRWLQGAELPVVFKLKSGASSQNVLLIRTKAHAERLINRMFRKGMISGRAPGSFALRVRDAGVTRALRAFAADGLRALGLKEPSPFEQLHKDYILFQRYLKGNTFDRRITVIGERAFASRRFVREGDFRASGSGRDDWGQEELDPRVIHIAFRISRELKFQCMSYDFLYNERKEPVVTEISYTSPDWTVWSCPGYWDENMGWHEGHFWPQYCILMDLLKRPDLKQPDLKPGEH